MKNYLLKNKGFILRLCIIAACSYGAALLFQKNNNTTCSNDKTVLTMGIAAGYAPFISINSQGDYEGFDIDIAQAVAQKLNKKLVLTDLGSMAPLLMSLNQGSVDAAIWALSITSDRLKKFAMVHYQGEDTLSYPLIFWNEIPAGIKTFDDMAGMTVCAEPASAQAAVVAKYPAVTQLATERVDDALLQLQYGKATAALVEPAIAKKFAAAYPEIKVLDVMLKPDDQVKGMGIAIRKDNSTTIQEITDAIDQLKKDGTIATLEKKWGIV